MAFAETAKLAVQIDLGGNASAGLRGLQKQVNGLGQSVGRVGKGFGQIGAGVARAGLVVGGAAVAGLGAAAKAAIDFEDAFAGVIKTVDEADLAKGGLTFDDLSDSFRRLSTEIPITAVEFARLGEAAGALGVDAKDIEAFTRTTAMLGVTTDLSADQAADALGRIGTILDFTGKDYENFADSLVALGNAGASTESEIIEISKRFAAEGNAAGLATEEIAGLASATASLGFAPERGGTALARVFANLGTDISLANKEGKAFASVTGRSIKDLQAALNRGEGLGIFLDVLKSIRGLSATDANKVLASLGITNTSDRTIFRTMASQLPFVNDQLEIAKDATGALLEEATKKFATTASKIQLFKNNLIEAGITVGEQFLPAVTRALDKVIGVLKDPGTKKDLAELGKNIGAAIDGIDWDKVLQGARSFAGVLKSALDVSLAILSAIEKLPTEVKAAGLALIGLNKVSGGLIGQGVGNVIGGLGETIVRGLGSKLPKVGSLFAQPVFVTNWPLGGIGGVPGAGGGGKGAAASALAVGAVAPLGLIMDHLESKGGVSRSAFQDLKAAGHSDAQAIVMATNGVSESVRRAAGKGMTVGGTLKAIVAAIPKQDNDPNTRQWRNDNKDRAKEIAALRAENREKLAAIALEVQRKGEQTASSVDQAKDRITTAQAETRRETTRGASLMSATTRGVAPPIVSAIHAARPIINVNVSTTSITKVTTTSARYGKNTGSGGQNQVRPA
jgi:TP901 family phage tail tape measure protein